MNNNTNDKDVDKVFCQFLLSMVNPDNANLIKELHSRWKEYLSQPVITFSPTTDDAYDGKRYTQSQLEEAERKAFIGGRARDKDRPLITTFPTDAIKEFTLYADKYPTFEDYKNNLKK